MSRRVVQVLSNFAAGIEIYSIDKAFLNFSEMELLAPDLLTYGIQVKKTVGQHTGILTCVGIAPTKTLAKLANRLARRQGTTGVLVLATPTHGRCDGQQLWPELPGASHARAGTPRSGTMMTNGNPMSLAAKALPAPAHLGGRNRRPPYWPRPWPARALAGGLVRQFQCTTTVRVSTPAVPSARTV